MMSQTALLEALKDLSTYTAISFTLDDYYCAEDSINTAKYFAKRGDNLPRISAFTFSDTDQSVETVSFPSRYKLVKLDNYAAQKINPYLINLAKSSRLFNSEPHFAPSIDSIYIE